MKIFALVAACALTFVSGQTPPVGPGGVDGDGVTATIPPPRVSGDAPGFTTVSCEVENCEMCLEVDVCQACSEGFSANHTGTTGLCTPCAIDDCSICDDGPDRCELCVPGSRLVTTTDTTSATVQTCVACEIAGCADCDLQNDIEVCLACEEGFFTAADGSCSECGENCVDCAAVDSLGNTAGCLDCADGYEPEIDGSCGLIGSDCGTFCLECEEHNQCKTCQDGYSVMLFNNGQSSGCAPCPLNCASCSDANTCDECEPNFVADDISGSCATQDQVAANVCDCRTTANNGCTCPGDEAESKNGCCDAGGICDPNDPEGVCSLYNNDVCTDFENCAYCFGQSFCGHCDIGYYKSEGRPWGDCIALPAGWDTSLCSTDLLYNDQCECGCGGVDPECVEHKVDNCEGDAVYCDADGACAVCEIEGCAYCANGDDGASVCLECADGYDLNDGDTCDICDIDGCASCQSGMVFNAETGSVDETTICRTCMDGYYSSVADGSCIACGADNCEQCSPDGCNKCLDGFSLDDSTGTCNSCGANCLQCGALQCNRCKVGYEVLNGACAATGQDCGNNCATCQRGGQCKICEPGYYVGAGTNGKCVACIDNCATCRDGESCTSCEEGYNYDINEFACMVSGDCLADICDCRSDTNNGCTCLENEGTAKLGCCNSDCGVCSDLCATYNNEPCTDFDNCEYCFEQTYCMECSEGYYQPDYHGDCVALPDGWDLELCGLSMLNNKQCDCECGGYDAECDEYPADGCDDGEYCASDATCTACTACSLAGCAHCSNGEGHVEGTCLECTDGHYQDDSGSCNDCNLDGCATCLAAGDEFTCKECTDGYYMNSNDLCAACTITECAVCNLEGACEECNDGFSLSSGECTGCPQNCLDCTGDVDSCKRCADGYEVLTDGSCGQLENDCGDNCLVCGAQGICKQCLNSYYRNSNSVCTSCMDNCGACNSGTTCNDCEVGYGWEDSSSTCAAYTDPLEYCAAQIRDGVLSAGAECECTNWECAEKSETPVRLRR